MSASPNRVKKFEKVENIVKWLGVVLAIAAGVLIYLQWRSGWLAAFGFICVAKFFGGELPHVIYHKKRFRRIAFYLTFPLFATVILYFTYRWWGRMWLSVLVGLVLGFILNVLVSGIFNIQEIYNQDQQKSKDENEYKAHEVLKNNPDAVAMKERFTDIEWREIKAMPPFMLMLVTMSSSSKRNKVNQKVLNRYYDYLHDPSGFQNPLLRMMLIDNYQEISSQFNDMNPLLIVSQMEKLKNTEAFGAMTSGASPESMVMIENTLNPEEFRSFIRSLFEFTLKLAGSTGTQDPQQFKMIIQFFTTFAGSKQDIIAMMDGVSIK